MREILEKDVYVNNTEPLVIQFSPQTELRLIPSLSSEYFFPKEGKTFNICPFSEQKSPGFLKVISLEDKENFFVMVTEIEEFPCPIKIEGISFSSEGLLLPLYEVMLVIIWKWEKGKDQGSRITSSIETTFEKIGKIQNESIIRNFYDEASRGGGN